MHAPPWVPILAAALVGLSACSSAPTATSPPQPAGGPTSPAQSASSSSAPSTTTSPTTPSGTSVQTVTNPCEVLTRSEASTLSGLSMPAGVQQPWGTEGAVKCGYHSGTSEVFVILDKAAAPQAAQAAWDAEKAGLQQQAQPAGVRVTATSVPGVGDRAELFVGSVTLGGVKNTIDGDLRPQGLHLHRPGGLRPHERQARHHGWDEGSGHHQRGAGLSRPDQPSSGAGHRRRSRVPSISARPSRPVTPSLA